MLVIGLTGPSGAGKSTVGQVFASFGLPILNADAIYHTLLTPPSECLSDITECFGRDVLSADGTLNRAALASIVFNDPEELEKLNHITHSYVLRDFRRQIKRLREEGVPAAVFDAPQLFESGADRECNIVVSVLASEETCLNRIVERDGITAERARERINAQKSDRFFRTHSDYIVENEFGTDNLIPQVRQILRETGVLSQ
ncbi:MAG: dephospho-CoA kinase [Clostridia bacterium]|nr:dephospho-CoA kinase [Clostridia bacterium]